MKKLMTALLLLLLAPSLWAANESIKPDEIITFKETETRELKLHVFYPPNFTQQDKRPVVVSFFGGGWVNGDPSYFYPESEFYNTLGLVAICADYRLLRRDKVTPYQCVDDGQSAIRWVRENCERLGVDPEKIIASGGSAGGHVAACTAMIADRSGSNISCKPNALILFNPVINTTKEGYGASKMKKGHESELSPCHHVTEGLPPTISFHGTYDKVSPYANALDFEKKMKQCGNDFTLIRAFGEGHGFYNPKMFKTTNSNRHYLRAMYYTANFLKRLGYTDVSVPKPKDKVRVACIGDSITFGFKLENKSATSWPGVLQTILGDDYLVGRFGVSGTTLSSASDRPYVNTTMYNKAKDFGADVIIVALGTNDSKPSNWSKCKAHFAADYAALIKTLRRNHACMADVYICSLTPSFYRGLNPIFDNDIIKNEIIPIIQEVAKKNKVGVVDCYTPFVERPALFPDKIHPTIEGSEALAKVIAGAIQQE